MKNSVNLRSIYLTANLVIALCASSLARAATPETPAASVNPPPPAAAPATTAAASRTAATVLQNYKLRPTDLIRFEVADDERSKQDVRLAVDGTIKLSYLDDPVKIAGLTVVEAADAIEKLYMDEKIYVKPHVNLLIVEYAERRITVLGQVNKQGPVPMRPEEEMTLVAAIAGAGGPNRIYSPNVTISRTLPDGTVQTFKADLSAAMKNRKNDVVLQDGDTVFVSEAIIGPGIF